MKLTDIATNNPVTIHFTDSLNKVIVLMEEYGIHHLPVVDNGLPVGMVSDRDLLSSVGWLSSHDRVTGFDRAGIVGPTRVTDVMSRPVHALHADASVQEGARKLLEERIGSVVLVANNKLIGIVTEKDYLQCYLNDHFNLTGTRWRFDRVTDQMKNHVFTCSPRDTLTAAIRLMQYGKNWPHENRNWGTFLIV